jgi:hypothetical protein
MLYLIHKGNSELGFQGGQSEIIHLEADLWIFRRSRPGIPKLLGHPKR